jgi:pimeloyl-ACP methyl ester carboxylesterase
MLSTTESDIRLPDGRVLHAYDTGPAGEDLSVCWHHGTPNVGHPPTPWFEEAERLGLRFFSFDRPDYGGSSPHPGRTVGDVATDAAVVADALGIDRFGALGHSGGGPHALACAALLPGRVVAAASVSGPAPYDADGLDWFDGMAEAGVASNRAAARGREARVAHEQTGDPEADFGFTAGDEEALGTRWSWLLSVVRPAIEGGPAGAIADDLAEVSPWGFAPAAITAPVLLVHGDADRVVPVAHGRWLATHVPGAELWVRPGDGHITVLDAGPPILAWLRDRAG